MDRPIMFSNGLKLERASPAPTCISAKSDQSMDRPIMFSNGMKLERASPAPTCVSAKSDQSMDRPITFSNEMKLERASPAPTCVSAKSDQSMDRPITFSNEMKLERASPAPTCVSAKSDQSMDRPITLCHAMKLERASPAPTCVSAKSDQSMDRPITLRHAMKLERASPAPTCVSAKSDQSMDRPITFSNEMKLERASPAPTCVSAKSDQSMDRPITLRHAMKLGRASPAPTCVSAKSDQSMDRPITLCHAMKLERASPAPTCVSAKSDQSMDRPITFSNEMKLERASPAPTCVSAKSDQSMDRPITLCHAELSAILLTKDHFRCSVCTDVLTEPVSIPCGHSYCKSCIQTYWTKPGHIGSYSCPQCRKRFKTRPVLKPNSELAKMVEKLQQAGFSPALPALCYAGPGDLACDFCTGRKLRAVKSCLTCLASYCETHVRQHYTVAALQRHTLVEATEDLEQRLCKLHHRALEVFCKTDQTFICFMCMMEEHKEHDTVIANSEAPTDELNTSVNQHQKIRKFNSLEENKMENVINYLLKENIELTTKVENLQRADTELTYLAKILCRGLEEGLVEMAALGRRLNLGMFYDCRSDSFSSDAFLWDESTLSSMKLSLSRPHTDVRILERDSLQERLGALDLTTPLRASVVAGLVEVSGAAAFLNHPTQSQLQDRVTLCYRTSTRLDMLSHTLLHSGAPLSLTSQKTATHVVVAVLYGIQAFFVFDDKRESREGSTALNEVIRRNFISHSAIELLSDLDENQQTKCLFDCAVYTDGGNCKSLVNFDTAIKMYSSLQTLGPQGEKTVPLKVWLYPLKNVDQTSACAAGELNDHILLKTENVLEHLKCHLSICLDMMTIYSSFGVFTRFPAIKESLSEISSHLQKYQLEIQKALASCIKTKRERGQKEGRGLEDLLKRHGQSPFSPENIQQWFLNKDAEVRALQACREKNITTVKSQEELMCILRDSQDTVLCFTLTSLEDKDPFLSALKQHIDLVSTVNTQETHLPFRLPDTSQKILSDLHSFMCTKETNEDADQTEFIAAVVPVPQLPGSSIYLYQCGNIVNCSVNLEMKPELPEILNIKQTSVTVRLQRSETQVLNHYRIEFRTVSCRNIADRKWKSVFCTGENCVVWGLTPAAQYQLRYTVMDYNSLSNYSRIKEFQTLPRARPGPILLKQTQKSLTVTWRKADGDTPVLCYMVEYMEAALEGWQSILTEGPGCECTITVPCSTCYRVRVSAVYVEGDMSRPSEEAEVPVDKWCINVSERKTSLFLKVLKLQTVKKPVELSGFTDEESEVRSFLQCLPYISQLRFHYDTKKKLSTVEFLLKLNVAAAECDAATGESFTKLLTSVCSYTTFPFRDDVRIKTSQCDFLLELFSQVKDYETQTGRSVLPALQPVYQSAPAVWNIDLSERKTSLFLEVLKLQTMKKPVELRGFTDEESEVKSFLQCLPYISQLRFERPGHYNKEKRRSIMKFLLKLNVAAAECDAATGESFTKLLTSVCSYTTFPLYSKSAYQCDFLLDLYSEVKTYETQTGRSVLPALQPVYQSAPAVWKIDLLERKTSLFLEVLKLQTVKKPVELRGWSYEESEVRSFLQCLPYISQLSFSGAEQCVPSLCKELWSREQTQQVSPLLQALGFTLSLGGELPTSSCRAVGRVMGLSASTLNLTLNPRAFSLRGARLLFTHITHLHTLRLSGGVVVRMVRALGAVRSPAPVTVEELSLILSSTQQTEGALSRVLSSLASLLRLWHVQCLNLTEYKMEAQSLTVLLCHQGPLTIRLSKETLQHLVVVVYEAQEEELTLCFLQKVGGELTSCTLNWEVIHYFLQYQTVTVDFRKSSIKQQNPRDLLPVLARLQIRRLSSSFVLSIIREIYQTGSAHCVSSLLSSAKNCINLNSRELDSVHCAALRFTLQHCTAVSLSLLFTSIPEGELGSILPLFKHVSRLSVDRLLLLRLLHCCSVSELQQGAAAADLLSALQHRLDFSCSSAMDLTADTQTHTLTLSTEDCRVVSMVIQRAHTHTQLTLHDCEIEEAGVEQLFPILHTVTLHCSKATLLQFLSLVRVGTELECVRRAVALSRALGEMVDLSQTRLDQQTCRSLALFLEHSEGLSELDLSHCQLTDHCLQMLLPHQHKAHVLDLSHNDITDVSAKRIYDTVSTNNNIHTVSLF
ncbi:uncharacterized protein LOC113569091 isoform X2 [Electrophorus electricus]|uniref:uncharacterized protein LOC113569091 isoform X2 n=1 Tax=Electrophorus electricus TaxID=8005 RepID=UPI0015D0C4DB|nr:uncharacterized protein LOC113569091 isoform X2 [Electrophorus electricus]